MGLLGFRVFGVLLLEPLGPQGSWTLGFRVYGIVGFGT